MISNSVKTKGMLAGYSFGLALIATIVVSCAQTPPTLYESLGGEPKVTEIVDHFIDEVAFDPVVFEYFKDSNIDRFREKLIEQICVETGGPCEYTGDSMVVVHTKMNVTESHFNHTVDLLIKAMDKANIPHPVQNKVLAKLVPMRKDIIYL